MPDTLFTTDAMRAVFSDHARVSRMLAFEAALAHAEERVGIIPPGTARSIAHECRVEDYDREGLTYRARSAGNLAIPLVAALTRRVGEHAPAAKGYVHWGATSQDVIDTGLVLQLRDALNLIDTDVERLIAALIDQIQRHKATALAGRTWLQQALPITLGLKFAGTLATMDRHRERLADLRARVLVIQFGGAVGTLASLGERAAEVESALAAELHLAIPELPWHTQRDRFVEVATTLGSLTATLGKLARDLSLLAQTEVGEVREPAAEGRGGSSTLPQKRNPVGCAIALAAATRVPGLVATMLSAAVQEHERGLGNWPVEWDTLPDIVLACAGALDAMVTVVAGLQVDSERMRANLDLTQGQVMAEAAQMALAPTLGRDVAHALVADACKRAAAQRKPVPEVLAAEPKVAAILDPDTLSRVFDPQRYLGVTASFIERALSAR